MRLPLIALGLVALIVVAGCGGGDDVASPAMVSDPSAAAPAGDTATPPGGGLRFAEPACSILSAADVEGVVGQPVTPTDVGDGRCEYSTGDSSAPTIVYFDGPGATGEFEIFEAGLDPDARRSRGSGCGRGTDRSTTRARSGCS